MHEIGGQQQAYSERLQLESQVNESSSSVMTAQGLFT